MEEASGAKKPLVPVCCSPLLTLKNISIACRHAAEQHCCGDQSAGTQAPRFCIPSKQKSGEWNLSTFALDSCEFPENASRGLWPMASSSVLHPINQHAF